MNDPKASQKAAGWQENPVAPTPVRHQAPLKIDLKDAAVEYEDGRIVAITGTLCVIPHTPMQHGPVDKFLKGGPVICLLRDQHFGASLALNFAIVQNPRAIVDQFIEGMEKQYASGESEAAKADGNSGTQSGEPVQQEQGGGKDVSQPAPRLRGDQEKQAASGGEEEGEEIT